MSTALQLPEPMTIDAFLAWDAPDHRRWQLVDGQPVAMAPPSPEHAVIQNELARQLGNHLLAKGGTCRAASGAGVSLGVRSDVNFRIPDIAVTCSPLVRGSGTLRDPVLLIEILSPGNAAETWINVWSYTTIPTVQEIAVIHGTEVKAQFLRRNTDGTWPDTPSVAAKGELELAVVAFRTPLAGLYAGTWLAEG
jgi:Uma2 family endonuclease